MNQKELESNMPSDLQEDLTVFFADERWSWRGLACILVKEYGKIDIEELIFLLQAEVEK